MEAPQFENGLPKITVYGNNYKERVNGPDGKPFDETAGER